ncbi:MAG: metallopeptidase TldD-related protein, partial [Elusimicrobiales bacterium]
SPESTAELRCDVYRDILERVSNVSKKYPKVKSVDFTLNISKNIMRFADSENRYFRKNSYQIVMRADIDFQDEKGYIKKDFKDFFYFSVEDFEKKAIADAEGYIKMFSDSYPAQEIDYFAAPCIFEKDAAFELINSLFVRNISFFPPPETEDENYLKYYYSLPRLVERIGKRVFPNFIDVYDDAGIKIYNGIQLVGAYDIDDEGVMPVKLRLVESGVLKTFYSSRRPSKYISYSNGRGRGNYDMYVYPFPSNVFIKSSKTYSDERFMKNVKKYAYEQGYDEVIFVEKIASSIKDTSKPIQSPVVAYIMNLKSGEKRYVTNIDFEDPGTRILRDILFTSEKEYVVNFFEKGPFYNSSSVAASLVVPEKIFVREIGLVKSQDKPQKKTYIPHPYFGR